MGMISSSFNSWSCLVMLGLILSIIDISSAQTAEAVGLLVGIVKGKGNSELISLAIIAPVAVEFEQWDLMEFVQCNVLGELE
eukprot:2643598-Ditylum_brightwellii.AAC.1